MDNTKVSEWTCNRLSDYLAQKDREVAALRADLKKCEEEREFMKGKVEMAGEAILQGIADMMEQDKILKQAEDDLAACREELARARVVNGQAIDADRS